MSSGNRPVTMNQDSLSELSRNVSQTASALFAAGNVTETLTSVAELAVATIEGCDFAGLFILDTGVLATSIFTDEMVLGVDAIQQRTGEGPSLDAIAHRMIVAVDDLETEPRWPHFSSEAVVEGIRSVLSLPLAPKFPRECVESLRPLSISLWRRRPCQGNNPCVLGQPRRLGCPLA